MAGERKLPGTEEVEWNGRKYRRFTEHAERHRRVYYMATTAPREYLHRDIYAFYHGPIPDGWHVHHRDHNPDNNDPANLEALSPVTHAEYHGTHRTGVSRICPGCGSVFVGARSWAKWCSPRCKERARRDAGLVKPRPQKGPFSELRPCKECGRNYTAKKSWQSFCSPSCKQRWGRRQ